MAYSKERPMKNAALAILSLALAAAVAFGIVSRKNLTETRDSLKTERASRLSTARDLESAREDSDRSVRELRRELDRLQAELSRAEPAESEAHGRLESLEKRYQEQTALLRGAIDSLKVQRDEVVAEISATRLECDSKSAKLEDALRRAAKEADRLREAPALLTAEVEEKEKACSTLATLLKEEQAKSGMLAEQYGALEKNVGLLAEELEAKEEAHRILESQIKEERRKSGIIMEEYALMDQTYIALKEELAERKEAFSALSEDRERCEVQVLQFKNELREALGSLGRLEEKIMDTSSTMEDLRHETRELRNKAQQKEREVEIVRSTYETLVTDLRRELERREVRIERIKDMIALEVVDNILFPPGRAAITPEGESVLRKVGDGLKTIKDRPVRVVGHTDNIPIKAEYRSIYPTNWELSAARACSVVRFFQHRTGLPPSRLEPIGRSLYEPASENDTPEGRALNRRVTIIIGPKLDLP
jgi:chemotaxis protein MotB